MSKRADKYMERVCQSLVPTDPRFDKNLVLLFQDGSLAHFRSAFYGERDNYVVVFSKRCGNHKFTARSVANILENEPLNSGE
jgi:hypothetical protein